MDLSLRRLLLAISCLLIPVSGLSDEVFLKNGDHLTGTVKTTKDGKLILETGYSGKIGINIADIQRETIKGLDLAYVTNTDEAMRIALGEA